MASLLTGAISDEDSISGGNSDQEEFGRDFDAGDEESHANLLNSIEQFIGSDLKRAKVPGKGNLRISQYQALSDDRGALPAFRGVKESRDKRKKKAKKSKKTSENDEDEDEEDLHDEVHDDPNVTKPELAKAKRNALYEHTKRDVSKWNSVVYHNRSANQLVFPLSNGEKISKRSIKDSAQEFVPQTPLEEEIAKILYGEEYVAKKKAELHSKEEKSPEEAYQLSIEQALDTHNELARLRAIQSYDIAKAKRRNKIKSKKYHRLLRKEKIKKQLKDFEELKQKDPEAALEKLQELEVTRAKERMTLKHRNTSKWAKSQAFRAKYDKDARVALAEQLRISKELTQKVQESSSDEDSDEEVIIKESKDGDAYQVKDYALDENEQKLPEPEKLNLISMRAFATPDTAPTITVKNATLDPKNYLVINPKFQNPTAREIQVDKELLKEAEEESGDDEDQRMIIAEAFQDDDVVSEFNKQKSDQLEASKPKDIDLTLPGWGEWGGKGVKPSKEKKKKARFVRKAPPAAPRTDARLSHVIINPEGNKKLREHQVKELPFPFKKVKDFEKIIRAPIGRTWQPERAMKDLTAPKVITRVSSVIKPISEDMLVKNKGDDRLKKMKFPHKNFKLSSVVKKRS